MTKVSNSYRTRRERITSPACPSPRWTNDPSRSVSFRLPPPSLFTLKQIPDVTLFHLETLQHAAPENKGLFQNVTQSYNTCRNQTNITASLLSVNHTHMYFIHNHICKTPMCCHQISSGLNLSLHYKYMFIFISVL